MRQVLAIPVYRRLLAAYGLNELTWSVGTLALAVLVYRRTGSALGSTAFFLCSQVIPALATPWLVARIDQRPPRRVLPLLYATEGVLFGLLALMTSNFSLVLVLVVVVLDGSVAIVARALARTATTEVLRPRDLLQEGNALTNMVFSLCYMIGPALGGLVVAAGGTVSALLVNCALFVGVALVLVTASGLPGGVLEPESTRRRLRAALAHARRDRAVFRILVLQAVGMSVFAVTIPVEVVLAQHTLHAGASGYGVMMSGWGAGAVLGSVALARWARHPGWALIAGAGLALAAGFVVMAAAPTIGVAIVGSAIAGVGNGIGITAQKTLLQQYTASRWMAMITGLNEAIAMAAPGVGILVGGAITQVSTPRAAMAVAGAGSLLFVFAVWALLRPRVLPAPPRVDPDPGPARQNESIIAVGAGSRETLE